MKIRIKFRKNGIMKFIGHLDIMRYFQKAMRRAEIDICFSEGFSPHMIMSFAAPLGVGLTSDGEYLDIEVGNEVSSDLAVKRLNAVMAEGIEIVSFRKIPEGKTSNAMSIVAAADYEVRFRDGCAPADGWQKCFDAFCRRDSILVTKKTKKSEQEIDIRPMIYQMERKDDVIFMQLATGSSANLKPELVMDAFASFSGIVYPEFALQVHRLEVYAEQGTADAHHFISLDDLGEDF